MNDAPPLAAPARGRGAHAGVFAMLGGKLVISLVSVAILALTWYGWQFIGDPNEGLATTDVFGNQTAAKPLDGAVDILLVGMDSRTDAQGNPLPREALDMLHAGESDGERQTDTMILVHIPQNGQRAVAISFPRDSWVELAGGFGKHKLNGAFVYAYNEKSKALQQQGMTDLNEVDKQAKIAGRKNLITTVEQFIGKPGMIDRYAEVNLASFYEVTKALGGVDVCLNKPVREEKSGVDLPGGKQTVQGVQALAFVRQRYDLPNGDLDRIGRQQAFLSGLARKVLSPELLTSPSKVSDVIGAVKKSVVLSEHWDLLEFAQQMRGLSGGNVEFRTVPVQGNAVIGGADVMKVDVPQVQAFVDKLTSDPGAKSSSSTAPSPTSAGPAIPGAEAIAAELFNGTGDAGLATRTQELLHSRGFREGGSTQLAPRATTLVRYAPGDEAAIAMIKQALGDEVQTEPDRDVGRGHLRVLLGKDYHGPPTRPDTPVAQSSQHPTTPPSSSAPPSSTSSSPESHDQPITAGGVPCVN